MLLAFVTNEQLYLAIGIPSLINIGLVTLLYLTLKSEINSLKEVMNARFDAAQQGLLSVEQVVDARLKHLEER